MVQCMPWPIDSKTADADPVRAAEGQSGSALHASTGRRILIVEDDISLAGFLASELEAANFTVELVHDGEAAFTRLQDEHRYDLLILDPANPRALVFQVESLAGHIAALPRLRDDLPPEEPLRRARALLAPLQSTTVADWDDTRLAATEQDLIALSEAISARYFLHLESTADIGRPSFLA